MFSRILVPLDGSRLAESVLPHAAEFARVFGSCLVLLRVLDPSTQGENQMTLEPFSWQIRKAEADLYLKNTAQTLRNQTGANIETVLLEGRAADTIIDYTQNQSIDLLAISTHGSSGLSRWNTSSVFQKVINKVYQHVLIVRAFQRHGIDEHDTPEDAVTSLTNASRESSPMIIPNTGLSAFDQGDKLPDRGGSLQSDAVLTDSQSGGCYQRILVPIDSSRRAECALSVASSLADGCNASLVLATVLSRPELPFPPERTNEVRALTDQLMQIGRDTLSSYLDELHNRFTTSTEVRLVEDDSVYHAIHQTADDENASLVIFCAHGQTGRLDWPYGSIVQNYIDYGERPVLIIQDMPRVQVRQTALEAAAEKYGSR